MLNTLLQLRTRARQRADMEASLFVEDSEMNTYINSAITDLHDLLVTSYGDDYYVKSVTFNTVLNQDAYALSTVVTDADFYKLRGLDTRLNANSPYYALSRFNFNERNAQAQSIVWNNTICPEIRYRIVGSNIILSPAPKAVVQMKLWYIPTAQQLTADGQTFDDINGYSDYVVALAARKAMMKEETDVSELDKEISFLQERIISSAKSRDAENPDQVQDIYASNNLGLYNKF